MVTEILVIVILLIFLIFLVIMMTGRSRSQEKLKKSIPLAEGSEEKRVLGSKCPLCDEYLPRGEKVHSHLFSGKPDGIMHIFGCPHCYKDHPQGSYSQEENRICPCCHDTLGEKDYLIARVFEKPDKTQVHVLGCTICREKRN
jgi:hypothetical protein